MIGRTLAANGAWSVGGLNPVRIEKLCYKQRRGDAFLAEGIVSLIVYYVVFMIIGDFAAYFLGLFTEYEWGSQVSLIVFLALYFLFLWLSWVLAVHLTKPKTA
jgi:hypothetical protein